MISMAVRKKQIVLKHPKAMQVLYTVSSFISGKGKDTPQRWTFKFEIYNDCIRNDECCNDDGNQEALLKNPERDQYVFEQHICLPIRMDGI